MPETREKVNVIKMVSLEISEVENPLYFINPLQVKKWREERRVEGMEGRKGGIEGREGRMEGVNGGEEGRGDKWKEERGRNGGGNGWERGIIGGERGRNGRNRKE